MRELYGVATNCTRILNVNVNQSHGNSTTQASIECESTSLTLGDYVEVNLGYTTHHKKIFSGYVKQIERKTPDNTYVITASDKMIRAIDFFIVPTNPDNAFSRQNISAESLVRDVMALAGLTSFTYDATSFTFGINNPAEVKLVSSYDFCRMVADLLTWNLWCDQNGTVHFENRKPYLMYGTSGQPGDHAETPEDYTIIDSNILTLSTAFSERNLRNRVVVWGAEGVYAVASADSPYLPDGFYKSALLSAPDLIDSQSVAQATANYNLNLFNRPTTSLITTVEGDCDLAARTVIHSNITLWSTPIDNDWYVYTAQHSWGKSGYTVELDCRV